MAYNCRLFPDFSGPSCPVGTSNPYSQNDLLGPFIHLSNERQCEGKFLVEERTQTQRTALELPNKPPLGIPVVYLKHLNSY